METLGCAGLPARREGRRHGQRLPCLLMERLSKMEMLECVGLPARREGRRHGQWLPCLLLLLLPAACSAAAGSCSATTTATLRALVDPAVYDRQVRPGRANLSVTKPQPDKIQVQLRLLSFKGVDTVERMFTVMGYFRVGVSRVHPGSPSVVASSARALPDARVDASRTRRCCGKTPGSRSTRTRRRAPRWARK